MLVVNEVYGPVEQGEGKSAGTDVLFLRLSGCNLACSWCDTPYTWNWKGTKFVHPDKFDKKAETHKMTPEEVVTLLKSKSTTVRRVVISGGEPMLQQKELIKLMDLLIPEGYHFEVETNGTIVPLPEFVQRVDQINCSPKLANSGPDNPARKREVPAALAALSNSGKASFKFVVSQDGDMAEVVALVKKYQMKEVYLMPEGRTRIEQEARQNEVERLSEAYGFHFSPRLHVLKWNALRAV